MKKLALLLLLFGLFAAAVPSITGSASFGDLPCPPQGPLLVCPDATVGQPYSLQLLGHDGCDLFWWRIDSGAMPPGMTLGFRGLVSGTPTATGTSTPWVSIHDLLASQGGFDWCAGDNQSERQFVFTVDPGAPPPPPPPPPVLKWYWRLTAAGKLLHSERAITYPDGSSGLGKMISWEQSHRDVIRVAGSVSLAHVQAAA